MRLPKYSNPHSVVDATQIVSRKTLQLQDDVSDGLERDGKEVKDLRVKLEEIVSKRFKLKRVLTSEDDSHSSKRRRILPEDGEGKPAEPQQHPEPIAFRLMSKSLPPHVIHLTPKPPKVVSVKEPSCEDTEQEFEERVSRSVLSAVDLEQIQHTFPMANDRKLLRLLKTTSQPQIITAPLLFLEVPLTVPLPMPWVNRRLNVPPKPSPHQLPTKGTCCPIVRMRPSRHYESHGKRARRKREKPKNKNKLVPR